MKAGPNRTWELHAVLAADESASGDGETCEHTLLPCAACTSGFAGGFCGHPESVFDAIWCAGGQRLPFFPPEALFLVVQNGTRYGFRSVGCALRSACKAVKDLPFWPSIVSL